MSQHTSLQIPLLIDLIFNIDILYRFNIYIKTKFSNGTRGALLITCKLPSLCNLRNYENILSKYIPHETITSYDRDLLWINKSIKKTILDKSQAYKSYLRSNKSLKNNISFIK